MSSPRLCMTAPGLAPGLALGLALALAGCADHRGDYTPHPAAQAYFPVPTPAYAYRIGAGDELALKFVVNPDLNAPVLIGPDGAAAFPLISSIPVAGLTIAQLNQLLTQRYAQVLRNPQVQVMVSGYGGSQVYVAGEVKTPGVFTLKGQLTVAQVLSVAGGMLDTARLGKVVLIRQRVGEARPLVRIMDVKMLYRRGVDNDPGPVLPGDLIFVPKSDIAEVDQAVDQYVNKAVPFGDALPYALANARQ